MTPRREVPLDPAEIIRTLVRHDVEFVVIGGLAVQAHGHVRTTQDAVVMPRPGTDNLERLAAALNAIGARPVGAARPVRPVDASELATGAPVALDTDAGGVAVHADPPGAAPYADISERSLVLHVAGVNVRFAGRDDLIAMKRASGRPVDRGDIAALTAGEGGAPA